MSVAIYAGDAGAYQICGKCGAVKALQHFHKDSREVFGKSFRCAECAVSHVKEYTKKNKAAVSERSRARRTANPEKYKEADKRRREKTAEQRRERERARYWRNRDAVLEQRRSESGRAYARIRMRDKLKNPVERLYSNVSRAIRASIADKKSRGWEPLVGYTIAELVSHIERQFIHGMTWCNHGRGDGKWHIDHIIPRSLFKYTSVDDPEFRACWALSNLRPMWGAENISKHAKRIYLI